MHPDKNNPIWREWLLDMRDGVLRAFREFLRTPTLMVTGFLLLALGLYVLDHADFAWIDPLREVLKKRLFVDSSTTSDFLGAIAAGIISVTSITISLLLLAVQQGASSMTSAVLDQFLRRTRNQAYFGYFIGLALYCLVVLSTVHKDSNAVLSATAGFVLTLIALYLLIMLLYSTVHQMRPTVIVSAIVDRTVAARDQQRPLLHRTRRRPQLADHLATTAVYADRSGYLVRVHLDALEKHIEGLHGFEIVLKLQIGSFVTRNDPVAEVRGSDGAVREKVARVLREVLVIERHRDIEGDPGQGIGQIGRIAWVTISTAKSSTGPAAHAIRGLRDLLSRWCDEPAEDSDARVLPLVYEDSVPLDLVDALESAVVASSESRQHQSFAEVLRVFSTTADRLPPEQRMAMAAMIERSIATIGEHVLTRELRGALIDAASMLAACGRPAAAARVHTTPDRLGRCLNEMPL
ncbi:MAG: DUF2254 family protein [Dyella sp.]|uniref:DUF2254 family protein n=1 Tax=Dyella sp. TaxID=1869338 RepID=UPI003F7E4190